MAGRGRREPVIPRRWFGENSTRSIRVTGRTRSTISHRTCATRSRQTRSGEPGPFALTLLPAPVVPRFRDGCPKRRIRLPRRGFPISRPGSAKSSSPRGAAPPVVCRSSPAHDSAGFPPAQQAIRKLSRWSHSQHTTPSPASSFFDGQNLRRLCAIARHHLSSRRLFSGGRAGNPTISSKFNWACALPGAQTVQQTRPVLAGSARSVANSSMAGKA